MKTNSLIKETGKWAFRAYIVWSICADLLLLAGVSALIFGDLKISY